MMPGLPSPHASAPRMFGKIATTQLLPWSWASERLTRGRNYWIATTRPNGSPHCRPVWGIWRDERGFYFSTGSLAARNLVANQEITVHLEGGDEVLIVEGAAHQVADVAELREFVRTYNPKYGWDCRVEDGRVVDSEGNSGPVYLVRPRKVFGWLAELKDPTCWSFDRNT